MYQNILCQTKNETNNHLYARFEISNFEIRCYLYYFSELLGILSFFHRYVKNNFIRNHYRVFHLVCATFLITSVDEKKLSGHPSYMQQPENKNELFFKKDHEWMA